MKSPFSAAFWRGFGSAFNLFPSPRDLTDLSTELLSDRRERTVWRSGPANAEPLPPPPKDATGQTRYPWYTVRPSQPITPPSSTPHAKKHRAKNRRKN